MYGRSRFFDIGDGTESRILGLFFVLCRCLFFENSINIFRNIIFKKLFYVLFFIFYLLFELGLKLI